MSKAKAKAETSKVPPKTKGKAATKAEAKPATKVAPKPPAKPAAKANEMTPDLRAVYDCVADDARNGCVATTASIALRVGVSSAVVRIRLGKLEAMGKIRRVGKEIRLRQGRPVGATKIAAQLRAAVAATPEGETATP